MMSLRAVLLLLCFSAPLSVGCGAIGFDVDQDLAAQTVPGSALGGILPSFLPSPFKLNIDVSAEQQKHGTGPATSAHLAELRFDAVGSPPGNFDFLDEIHVFVAPTNGGSLPKQEIAKLAPVPDGKTTIELTILPGVDLLPYINAGAEISATATGTQPAHDFTFTGHVKVNIRI